MNPYAELVWAKQLGAEMANRCCNYVQDHWMPYFIAVYPAGGGVENGFHELPILANGQRLWAGSLGRAASFGCIILGIPEAGTLYNWAEVGVVVVIE